MKKSMIGKIANEIADLVERKNKDYGNSFDKTLDEYGDVAYFLRIEDKISRLKSLTKKEALVTNESIEDTLKDIVGYTLLMINYKRSNREVFIDAENNNKIIPMDEFIKDLSNVLESRIDIKWDNNCYVVVGSAHVANGVAFDIKLGEVILDNNDTFIDILWVKNHQVPTDKIEDMRKLINKYSNMRFYFYNI